MNINSLNISNNNFFDLSIFKNLNILTIDRMCNISLPEQKQLPNLKTICARSNDVNRIKELMLNSKVEIIRDW